MPVSPDEERVTRLLDAAADRVVRFGYDKTSVADVAREARVSKGAVYLSFASKEALFEALLVREMRRFAEAWLECVEADPRGGTLGPMYAAMLRALDDSPVMARILRHDREFLGRYLNRPDNLFRRHDVGQPTRYEFIAMLQQAGAVRTDVDARVVARIMDMISHGMLAADSPNEGERPAFEAVIEGVAMMMDRAFTPADGGNSEAGKALLRAAFEQGRKHFDTLFEACVKGSAKEGGDD